VPRPIACFAALACALAASPARAEPPEEAPAPPPPRGSVARVVDRRWVELELPENAYDDARVSDPAGWVVRSPDDPAYAAGLHPSLVHHRHRPESAPWVPELRPKSFAHLEVVYRVSLRLPRPLEDGRHYRVEIGPGVVADPRPLELAVGPDVESAGLHANLVAFPEDAPKAAYLAHWTGEGAVDFAGVGPFEVVDAASGAVAFRGEARRTLAAADDLWSKSDVLTLDFSALRAPGRYRVRVAGVGASRPFAIGDAAMRAAFTTIARGLLHQRDGRHGLERPEITRFTRPPAHLDDAVDEASGRRVDLVGGHMDAGDRGKYPAHAAEMAASLLAGAILFPGAVERVGESLGLPESGNGVPDVVDEALVELDWLAKVVEASADGRVALFVRPTSGGYEPFAPPEGEPSRRVFTVSQGPYRAETLATAGALAMACATPMLQRFAPNRLGRYAAAARRAFDAFERHADDDAAWKPDAHAYDPFTTGPHPWSDELLLAAANLLEITGEARFARWIDREMPPNPARTPRWGWSLEGPWLAAFLSIARSSRLPDATRAAAIAAIRAYGDAATSHDGAAYARPYGAPLPTPARGRVGWFFSGSATAFPLMVAYGVTGEARYRRDLAATWSWLLAANPLDRVFFTGLGPRDRRPRWPVHEIARVQWVRARAGDPTGWPEPPPGFPAADLQSGWFERFYDDAWNTPRRDRRFPALEAYAPIHRFADAWATHTEPTIERMARGVASLLPLLDGPPPSFERAARRLQKG
jgi:hypothetical protein